MTFAAFLAVALLFKLYAMKNETRVIEARVGQLAQQIAETKTEIAALEAEWSARTDPARIERLARQHLGLGPVTAQQIKPVVIPSLSPPQERAE